MVKIMHNFARSHIYIYIYIGIAIFLASLISLGLIFNSNINSVHATNPQSVDYNVYVKPSLNISVSSNNVVLNINPAGSLNGANNPTNFASSNLNVSVATNNQYGYRLYMNSDTSDLVKTDDNTEVIPTLSSATTEANFPYNRWGYKFSTDTDYQPFQANHNTLISSSDTATNNVSKTLNFGAKANYDKKAGTYELDLNFKALPTVTTYYMQDIASDSTLAESVCTTEPTVVIDKRDEKSYTIRRINGDCWMVENLQFVGDVTFDGSGNVSGTMTLTPETSNVATTTTLSYGDLTLGNSYDDARIHVGTIDSGSSPIDTGTTVQSNIPTVWYNYAAASAGTIIGSSNTNPQLYDICPAGWKLPNYTESNRILSYTTEFSPTIGGIYQGGELLYENIGLWWTPATPDYPNNSDGRRALGYSGNSFSWSRNSRYFGIYVRCIMKSSNINDLNYMQDFARVAESDTATGDNKKQQIINSMELNSTTGYTLKDIRDNQEYTINKIGPADNVSSQNIWMTKNLAIGCNGSSISQIYLDSSNTNITSSSWRTPSALLSAASVATETADYSNPRMQCNQTYGAWYNYAATTAGTIINASNTTPATKDICPAGWNIPSSAIAELITGSSYAPIFNFSISGGYIDGSINNTRVWWWTSSPANDSSSAITRSTLKTAQNTSLWTDNDGYRFRGFHIRCVVK